jgi:hypothetical protein
MSHDSSPHYDRVPPVDQAAEDAHPDVAALDMAHLLADRGGFPWRRCAASLVIMVLVLIGALAGGLYWRLGKAPIELPFLTERVLAVLGTKLPPGFSADLQGVALGRRGTYPTIELRALTLHDASGAVLASAPRIDVELALPGLITGSIEPRSVVVDGATAVASVDKNGRVGLHAVTGLAEPPADLSLTAMLGAVDALLAAAGSLDTVELKDATLIVEDRAFGRQTAHRDIDALVRRTAAPGGLALSLAAGGGTIDATIESRDNGLRLVDVQARGIALQQIAAGLAPGAKPPDLTAGLDAVGRASIAEDGTVTQASLDITSSGGSWRMEAKVPPFRFDRAALSLRWDGSAKIVTIDRAMLGSGEGVGAFSGRMVPPADGATDWLIELDAPGLTLAGPQPGDAPLKLDLASIRARYNTVTRVLGIDHAQFSGPAGGLAMAGSLSFNGKTPGIGLGIAADRMSVAAVKRFWPIFAAPPARQWFIEHAQGGVLEKGTISLAIPEDALVATDGVIPPLPDRAVQGAMAFSQSSMTVVDTLPPLTDVEAQASFSARTVKVTMPSAKVDLGDAGSIDVSDGVYAIADLVPTPAMQHVSMTLDGPARAVAMLMTREPLAAASRGVALEPDQVTGQAELKVAMDFPTLPKLTDADFTYHIAGDLQDFGIDQFEGQKLEKGSLKVAVEPGVVLLTGKATLAGLPARIDYRKASDQPPQVTMTATLDDAARKKRGLDFGDALNGPVTAEVRVAQSEAGPRYAVDVDLAAARITDLLPGWQKPPGRPGKASFLFVPKGEGGTLDEIAVDSGSIALRGSAVLGPDGKFRKGSFDTVRFAPGDDASATVEAADGGYKIALRGPALDLRPTLTMLQKRGAAPSSSTGALSLDVKLDKAVGFGDETLDDFELGLDVKSRLVRRFSLKGSFGSRGITGATRNSGNGSAEIFVETVDAGSLLRFLDYYTHVDGGVLQAALTPTLDRIGGQVFIRNFTVTNETALGQYRTTLERSGQRNGDAVASNQDGNSAKFDKLRLTFERSEDRLSIAEAVVWGPEVGANLSGFIDYAADKVSLTGTFVPAYALNNLFSQIPVIGMILGGGQHEGLFAINFKVSGPASAPTLTINPLSAIAPGFLRKLFEFQKASN